MAKAKPTTFQRVAEMNTAFGNPQGNYNNIDWARIERQVRNIAGVGSGDKSEYTELLQALAAKNAIGVRDALCDIKVFADGALHLMGCDGDADMHAVLDGVMTRFVKDADDLDATRIIHAKAGVLHTYTEGEFPKMILKSAVDQPDAPQGKFLKSASYRDTVFPTPPTA